MPQEKRRWLVICSCGWGREASSEWAADAVSRLHQRLAEAGAEHVMQIEGSNQRQAGQRLMLD